MPFPMLSCSMTVTVFGQVCEIVELTLLAVMNQPAFYLFRHTFLQPGCRLFDGFFDIFQGSLQQIVSHIQLLIREVHCINTHQRLQ